MVERGDWSGLVRGRNDDFDALHVVAPEAASAGASWGGPFRVTASDRRTYFVKSLQTCVDGGEASLAVEQVVARLGRLIGAPVCETSLIRIPSALAGWRPHQNRRRSLRRGWRTQALPWSMPRKPGLHSLPGRKTTIVGVMSGYTLCMTGASAWIRSGSKTWTTTT